MLFIATAVGVPVAVRVGIPHYHTVAESVMTSSSTASLSMLRYRYYPFWVHILPSDSTLFFFSSKSTSVLPQNTTPPESEHHILNDTSIASVVTSNGSRHVFFQEVSGVIRESIYEEGQWMAPINYIIDTGRNYTPLSAVYIPAISSEDLDLVRSSITSDFVSKS